MAASKRSKAERAEAERELDLRELCARCRVTRGRHGATPPHSNGDECPAFVYSNMHAKQI